MAKRILTPIDGCEESTAIVPVVAALARGAGSTVRLLRVYPVPERVMGPHGRTIAYVDQEMARLTALGLDELAHVEAELEGIPVERVVRFGEPSEEIRLEAEAFNADLIVASDGINSFIRNKYTEAFAPDIEVGKCRFVWLGTHKLFDAFTFAFEETHHGWFQAHAYKFDRDTSTFIV